MRNATGTGRKPRSWSAKAERRAAERRRERRRQLAYVLAAVAAIAIAAVLTLSGSGSGGGKPSAGADVHVAGRPRQGPLQPGDAVPDFSAPGLDGAVSWSSYAGKPTVLAVWAPWCPHCQKELPILAAIAADFPNVPLVSVATAIGQAPGPSPKGYMRDHGLTFPVAVDDGSTKLGKALGIRYFPTVYYVGPDGKVVRFTEGEVDPAAVRGYFQELSAAA